MPKTVKVYSTDTCPYCTMAKNFLMKNSIAFEDVNVGQDQVKAQEMLEKSGQSGVPVIEIDNKIIIGFDIEEISKELNIKPV